MSDCKLQIGCMLVLIYLAFVYYRGVRKYHRKLREKYFDELLILGMVCVFFDGATAYTVNRLDTVSPVVNRVLHFFFLISIDLVIFALFFYMLYLTGYMPKRKRYRTLTFLPLIINIAVVLIFIGDLEYRHGNITNYSMGVSVYTCFITAAVYILFTIIVFFKKWNYIESGKRAGIITYMFVITAATVLQMIFPEILFSSAAYTIVILGIYLNSEDPAITELSCYYSETVTGFANLIENRDGSTGGHIKRTAAYVKIIAEELRDSGCYSDILTKDYIENLLSAAPMHDIGKISVPDAILQKPGKLTDEEYDIMKKHAPDGGRIIKETFGNFGNEEYCEMAYQVARFHHEKWNGRGYPDGLERKDIPLCARIMAVADVFDAVSQKRCYRDAMPLEKCFSIIENGSGQDFDPIIVEAFMNVKEKVVKIHGELNNEEQ